MTLEFCWCDLEAANFHDLLEAINDEHVVIFVDHGFVACADPSNGTDNQLTFEGRSQNYAPIYKSLLCAGKK